MADRTVALVYGPEHQRLRQTVTLTSNAPSHMEPSTTWYMNGPDSLGLSYEREVKDGGMLTEHKHYLVTGGESFALYTLREGVIGDKPAQQVSYFHYDHLGSLSAVTNEAGEVAERLAYDPWGKRRNTDGLKDPGDTLTASTTKRGYTMHEHMDEVGVINMNGRVYDPAIGRFLTADPHIQTPQDLQSFNRYSYVKNNPLAYTDPSGYFLKKLWKKVKKAIRAIVAVVVAVVIVLYAPQILTALTGSTITTLTAGAKMMVGALAGGLSSAISAGTGKAFWKGAFSGALFAAAGLAGAGDKAYSFQHYAAHAGAGCVSAVASGGNCGRGMASALVGKFTTMGTEGIGGEGIGGDIARGAMASVAGGLACVAGGGEFDDGATTAAFGYLFNQVLTSEEAEAKANARDRAVMNNQCVSGGPMVKCSGVSDFGYSTKQTAEQREALRTISGNIADGASTGLAAAAPWSGPAAPLVVSSALVLKGYSTWANPPTVSQVFYDAAVAPLPLFTQARPILDTAVTFGTSALRPGSN